MSFADRRAQRQWRREMDERLAELRRLDRDIAAEAEEEPSALPPTYRPMGPIPGSYKPHKAPRQRGPVGPGLLVVALIMGGVFLFNPSETGQRMREMLGVDGRLGDLVVADGDGEYAFTATQPGSQEPVSWNPCRPIRYVVNPAGAPDGWEGLIDDAVDDISDATGFKFEYEGESDDRNFGERINGLGRPDPVLIGWADEEEIPRLGGDVAGLGGSAYIERDRHRTYVTGSISLDSELFTDLAGEHRGEELMRAIITHELGHVVGLDHVDDPSELMFEDNVGQTELGPGDKEGLALLGAVECA